MFSCLHVSKTLLPSGILFSDFFEDLVQHLTEVSCGLQAAEAVSFAPIFQGTGILAIPGFSQKPTSG